MFCKFCGQNIPDTSELCPECGKKLKKKEESKEKADRRPINTPLALMLIILCWSTVFAWGRILLFGDQAHIGMVISTVMLVVGLVLLGTMISRERIYAETYRFSDLLALCCVWMVVPALMWRWNSYVVYHTLGQYAGSAWLVWENGAIPAIQFSAFWLLLGIIVLGPYTQRGLEVNKKAENHPDGGAATALCTGLCVSRTNRCGDGCIRRSNRYDSQHDPAVGFAVLAVAAGYFEGVPRLWRWPNRNRRSGRLPAGNAVGRGIPASDLCRGI